MDMGGLLLHARVEREVLETWIGAGWIIPRQGEQPFSEVDVARVQLIRELKEDLGANDEAIAIILDLADQIHGLRGVLRNVLSAIHAQPAPLRGQIIAHIRAAPPDSAR